MGKLLDSWRDILLVNFFIILVANTWGLVLNEWEGVTGKTLVNVFTGILFNSVHYSCGLWKFNQIKIK